MIDVLIGMVSGFISSLGLGGGSILILLLNLFKDVSQHIMQGTNLIFFIFSATIASFINMRNKHIDFKNAKWMIFAGIIGAMIGCKFSLSLNKEVLKKYFGVFLIVIAILEIYSLIKEYTKKDKVNTKNIK